MKKTFLIISVLLGILFYPVNAQQRIVEAIYQRFLGRLRFKRKVFLTEEGLYWLQT